MCELMAALQTEQPKVSRSLALMKRAGLLQDRRQGQWVFYRLADALPDWILDLLAQLVVEQSESLALMNQGLQRMGERPQRLQSCC